MVLKTYSCKDLQAILKIFKVNFVVVVVDVRKNEAYNFFKFVCKLRSTIK